MAEWSGREQQQQQQRFVCLLSCFVNDLQRVAHFTAKINWSFWTKQHRVWQVSCRQTAGMLLRSLQLQYKDHFIPNQSNQQVQHRTEQNRTVNCFCLLGFVNDSGQLPICLPKNALHLKYSLVWTAYGRLCRWKRKIIFSLASTSCRRFLSTCCHRSSAGWGWKY